MVFGEPGWVLTSLYFGLGAAGKGGRVDLLQRWEADNVCAAEPLRLTGICDLKIDCAPLSPVDHSRRHMRLLQSTHGKWTKINGYDTS